MDGGEKVKTRAVAAQLQMSRACLLAAIGRGKVKAPAYRDCSGHLWWTAAEIEAARRAMATDLRRRKLPASASEADAVSVEAASGANG